MKTANITIKHLNKDKGGDTGKEGNLTTKQQTEFKKFKPFNK